MLTMKAIHHTGICIKNTKCIHQKNKVCTAKYHTLKAANDAVTRFKAHGFSVKLIKNEVTK